MDEWKGKIRKFAEEYKRITNERMSYRVLMLFVREIYSYMTLEDFGEITDTLEKEGLLA